MASISNCEYKCAGETLTQKQLEAVIMAQEKRVQFNAYAARFDKDVLPILTKPVAPVPLIQAGGEAVNYAYMIKRHAVYDKMVLAALKGIEPIRLVGFEDGCKLVTPPTVKKTLGRLIAAGLVVQLAKRSGGMSSYYCLASFAYNSVVSKVVCDE
ncbi:MAG: hypothetical protein HRU28_13440 [Rhizobiales bacterium]|nr:hypothetical protein [Hyphomicrobiales bacterium]